MVSGSGKVGGFLDRIEQWFDWSAFEDLLSPIHGSATGVPGYPPLTMSRSFFCSNGIRSLIRGPRRRCAIGCRSAAFAACRWRWRRPTTPRSGDFAKRSTSLACRRSSSGQGQPATRCARLRHQRGTAHRRDHHRRGGQAPLTCAAASIRATRTRISHWPSPFQPKAARARPATSVASGGADAGKLGESVEPGNIRRPLGHAPRACSPASRIQVRSAKAT